ncbi:MAG: DUF6125 family protein [Firmicutes bacterium]|nr:DUF6125 family protein [Bacillota bacterium]MCL5038365.1 DUF6125 family protein [Bacillota bacterium]
MEVGDLSRDRLLELLQDMAKRWLAHDGLWFQAVERAHGMDEAIRADSEAWRHFTVIEAERIKRFLNLPPAGGLAALAEALNFRLYALVNRQEAIRVDEKTLLFRMNACRVQEARRRKGLPDFPCKSVGLVEYSWFARTIDPRIETRVLTCPPDEHPPEYYCAWEFTLKDEAATTTRRDEH